MSFIRLGSQHGLSGFAGLFPAALTAQSLSLVSTGYNGIFSWAWNASKMVSSTEIKIANFVDLFRQLIFFVYEVGALGDWAARAAVSRPAQTQSAICFF